MMNKEKSDFEAHKGETEKILSELNLKVEKVCLICFTSFLFIK